MRKKTNKKHIGLKVFLVILFFLILVCIAVAVTQRDNISAVIDASKYSKVDIQKQMDDTKTEVQKTLEEYNAPAIRDFTPQEEEDIRKGRHLRMMDAWSRANWLHKRKDNPRTYRQP